MEAAKGVADQMLKNASAEDSLTIHRVIEDQIVTKMDERRMGAHKTHCCLKHGCKYGNDEDCPVFNGSIEQEYLCMDCDEDGISDLKMLHQIVKAEKVRKNENIHKIVVHPEPDEEMAKQGTPYFWCVLRWSGRAWHNLACNWSSTRLGAFEAAESEYEVLINEEAKKEAK
jgi:hypothetical protein